MGSENMKYAALVAGAALFLTANVFSTGILTERASNKVHTQYTKVSTTSSTGQTTPNDAREELIGKASEKDANVIVLSSGDTDKKLHVSANVYKKK